MEKYFWRLEPHKDLSGMIVWQLTPYKVFREKEEGVYFEGGTYCSTEEINKSYFPTKKACVSEFRHTHADAYDCNGVFVTHDYQETVKEYENIVIHPGYEGGIMRIYLNGERVPEEKVKWKIDLASRNLNEGSSGIFLTLADLTKQLMKDKQGILTVVIEDVFCGNIYQYGNHGARWEHHGTTKGFA